MTVKTITEEILDEAREQAETLIHEITKEAEKLVEEETLVLKEKYEKAVRNIDQEAEKIFSTALVKANFKLKNEELKTRRSLVDEAFDKALEKLKSMSKEERQKIIRQLLKKASSQMEVSTVYVSSQDKALVPKGYTVKTGRMNGGIIAETKDGSVRLDMSYEAVLNDFKEKKVEEIIALLER